MTTAAKEFAAMRGSGRPDEYRTKDGKRVPSVTTITGRFKNPQGLYWWHWQNGREGREFGDGGEPALEIGSLVHRMVEARIHDDPMPKIADEYRERAESSYGAWERWFDSNRFEIVATEIPFVSEEWRFGGTIDCVLRDQTGALCLGDWKTSKGIYPDYLIQLAAYGALWNEHAPEGKRLTGGFHLVRFSKEHGDMEYRHFPDLSEAWEMFKLIRQAYELDKQLAKRAK